MLCSFSRRFFQPDGKRVQSTWRCDGVTSISLLKKLYNINKNALDHCKMYLHFIRINIIEANIMAIDTILVVG